MLTIQTSNESGKRLLLGVLIACFMALLLAELHGAETKPTKPITEQTSKPTPETTKPAPSDPTIQSVPYYDPKLALCSSVEEWGYWWNYFGCYDVVYGGGR